MTCEPDADATRSGYVPMQEAAVRLLDSDTIN